VPKNSNYEETNKKDITKMNRPEKNEAAYLP
jgi:hypothetical protein